MVGAEGVGEEFELGAGGGDGAVGEGVEGVGEVVDGVD